MPALTTEQIQQSLTGLSGWAYTENALRKQYQFADFRGSIAFVNAVAVLAEAADHHPDITILYNRVVLALSSHDAGGVTQRDLDLAGQIEALQPTG